MVDKPAGQQHGWLMLSVTAPRELEETASAILFELGSTGVITLSESKTEVQIAGYFPDSAEGNELVCQLSNGLSNSAPEGSAEIEVSYVPDQDWLQKWKEGYEPVAVGERILVVPSWKLASVTEQDDRDSSAEPSRQPTGSKEGRTERDPRSRIIILIDPGMAFGTGTHETTRLCLTLIERYWRGGSLLDVGTGTGILAIAAEKLAPDSRIIGIDVDLVAVEVAIENARINGVSKIEFRQAQPRDISECSFDVVAANLTADLIAGLLDDLTHRVAPAGILLLSGILREQAEEVAAAVRRSNFNILEQLEDGEWVALALKGEATLTAP